MKSCFVSRMLVAAAMFALACGAARPACGHDQIIAKQYAVTSGHPAASEAGLQVLKRGGNVIDAAVTASISMGVAAPWGSGLGGKMVMLYREGQTGKIYCVEALNAAPKQLDPDTFIRLPPARRVHGYAAVCVPGMPAGLQLAHSRWGRLPWRAVVEPAAELAAEGIEFQSEMRPLFAHKTLRLSRDPTAARFYLLNEGLPPVGRRMCYPELATSLHQIAEQGAKAFYRGEIAERIVDAARSHGSSLTMPDFEHYEPRMLEPLVGEFEGCEVVTAPPPTTGGVTVLAALGVLAQLDWTGRDVRDLDSIDQMSRVLRELYPRVDRAIADNAKSVERAHRLLSPEALETVRGVALAAAEQPAPGPPMPRRSSPAPMQSAGSGELLEPTLDDSEDASTSQLVVADSDGNVVCITQSLSYHFGASVVAPETGVLLNNSMSNFNLYNSKSVNAIAPGKRPRSTIAPVIVMRENHVRMAFGIPGGQRIASTTALILLDTLKMGRSLPEALGSWRYHLRRPVRAGQPYNCIDIEEDAPAQLVEQLADRGWQSEEWRKDGSYFGGGNGVEYLPDGSLLAAADPRRINDAAGQ